MNTRARTPKPVVGARPPQRPSRLLNLAVPLLMAMSGGLMAQQAWAQVQLVTDEEARLPEAGNLLTRAITRGPAVRLASAAEVSASSFPLEIRLEARGGARIDASSLKVEYLKSPTIDLTGRIQGLLRDNVITAPAVRVPAGLHRLRVSVQDSDGRTGSAVLEIRAR